MPWLWLILKQFSPIWAKPNKRKCWHSHQNFVSVGWTTRLECDWKIFGESVTATYTKSWNNPDKGLRWLKENIWLSLTQVINASLKALEGSSKKASIIAVIFLPTIFNETMSTIPCYVSYAGMESAGRRFIASGKNSQHRNRNVTQMEVDTEGQLFFNFCFHSSFNSWIEVANKIWIEIIIIYNYILLLISLFDLVPFHYRH